MGDEPRISLADCRLQAKVKYGIRLQATGHSLFAAAMNGIVFNVAMGSPDGLTYHARGADRADRKEDY